MKITTKYDWLEYVRIKDLDNVIGRIVKIIFDGVISYNVQYWVNGKIEFVNLYEDEISQWEVEDEADRNSQENQGSGQKQSRCGKVCFNGRRSGRDDRREDCRLCSGGREV